MFLFSVARLKTVSLVVKHSQSAEALVRSYESKLYEEDAMTSDPKSIEAVIATLKVVCHLVQLQFCCVYNT